MWIATLANWPLWRALAALPETASTRGLLFGLGFAALIAAVLTGLLALLAWRWSIKTVLAFVLLSAAVAAHYMGTYGVVLDPTMMQNVVQTDARELRDLLSWRLVAGVVVLAGLPMLVLWQAPLQRRGVFGQAGRNAAALLACAVLAAALVFVLFADLSATMRNHKSLRYMINPLNAYFSLGVVARQHNAASGAPLLPIGLDAKPLARAPGARPPLLLLVIGETARADHFALNGYSRATNPELAPLDVLSFANVTACGTNTAASLPCMFSHLGRAAFEQRDGEQENLLDLLQRAGLAVLWLDNQSGCKGLCERVPNARASVAAAGGSAPPGTLCDEGECLDGALLHGLSERLADLPAARRERGAVLVLHMMGSHGPAYYKRSPPERKPFLPECTTNVLQQCEAQQLINAYDNSIAYTDHVLAAAIAWLQAQAAGYDPALLYVSDHGESLGENNLYLHGLPYALAPMAQKHVPMLLWLPAQAGLEPGCLRAQREVALTHDNLFHTVLGLLSVRASEYRPGLDALAPCRLR